MAVLVVEDELLIRYFLACDLKDAGFDVIEATNADDALIVFQSRTDIEAVVTDINMPGSVDGLRLAHTVCDRWPPIKLVVVSGRRYLAAEELPANAVFVGKPFMPSDVIGAINGGRS